MNKKKLWMHLLFDAIFINKISINPIPFFELIVML